MNEVEKKSVRRWKASLVVAAALVGTLAVSSLWLFMRSNSFQIQVRDLETENVSLQTEVSNLTSVKSSLQSEVDDLTKSNTDLQNQLNLLNTTYQNYVSTHRYNNSEYESYVANHLYSNLEYAMLYDEASYSFYYVKPEDQKFGVYNLDDELNGLEWTEPYQEGVFDCSEMSACLEWFLENEGWHVKIYVGDSPFGDGKHAWLIVETSEGKYMPVESTTIRVVWWSDSNFDNYWEYDYRFETVQDAIAYSESGFDWWELGFSPLGH